MKQKVKYPHLEKCRPLSCISSNMMKCNRIVANTFRKHLKPFGVTDSQLSILLVVTKATSVNQKKIAEMLFMEKSTVNRNIVRLIDNEYISMEGDLVLTTTEKGKLFLESVLPHWEMAMEEMRNILGEDGTEALFLIANKLTQ
ncbi:MAG: MarR family transcriptional regulator [Bacteroidota bacterium]